MRELIDAEATIKMHAAALIAIETAIERQQFAVCPRFASPFLLPTNFDRSDATFPFT